MSVSMMAQAVDFSDLSANSRPVFMKCLLHGKHCPHPVDGTVMEFCLEFHKHLAINR